MQLSTFQTLSSNTEALYTAENKQPLTVEEKRSVLQSAQLQSLQQCHVCGSSLVYGHQPLFTLLMCIVDRNCSLKRYVKGHDDIHDVFTTFGSLQLEEQCNDKYVKYSKLQLLLTFFSLITAHDIYSEQILQNLQQRLREELGFLVNRKCLDQFENDAKRIDAFQKDTEIIRATEKVFTDLHDPEFFVPNFIRFAEHYRCYSKFDLTSLMYLSHLHHQLFRVPSKENNETSWNEVSQPIPHLYELSFHQMERLMIKLDDQNRHAAIEVMCTHPFHNYDLSPRLLTIVKNTEDVTALLTLKAFQASLRAQIQKMNAVEEITLDQLELLSKQKIKCNADSLIVPLKQLAPLQIVENPALLSAYESWQQTLQQAQTKDPDLIKTGDLLVQQRKLRLTADFQRRNAILKEEGIYDQTNIDPFPNLNAHCYASVTTMPRYYDGPYKRTISEDLAKMPTRATIFEHSDVGLYHQRDPRIECTLLDAYYEFHRHVKTYQQHPCMLSFTGEVTKVLNENRLVDMGEDINKKSLQDYLE